MIITMMQLMCDFDLTFMLHFVLNKDLWFTSRRLQSLIANSCDEAFSFYDYNEIDDLRKKNHVLAKISFCKIDIDDGCLISKGSWNLNLKV